MAAAAVSGISNVEFWLCAKAEFGLIAQEKTKQVFPNSHKLLTQPSLWIGDTAATMDMMPHEMGYGEQADVKR